MTLNSTRRVLLFSTMMAVFACPALAQEKTASPKKDSVVKVESDKKGPTGPVKDWIDAENALIDPLSDKDKESFFILRNKYSIIRVVRVVERDIGKAVKSCGETNPGMKSKMNDRFDQWKNAVNPIIDTAEKQLEKDIDSQKIVDAKQARVVLKLNDKAYNHSESQITKKPVTTAEACQGLVDSMDRTEDNMIALLQQTLLPESAIRSKVKRAEPQAEKASAKAPEKAPEKSSEKAPAKKEPAAVKDEPAKEDPAAEPKKE